MAEQITITLAQDSALLFLQSYDEYTFRAHPRSHNDHLSAIRNIDERLRRNPLLRDAFRAAKKMGVVIILQKSVQLRAVMLNGPTVLIHENFSDPAIIEYLLGTDYIRTAA